MWQKAKNVYHLLVAVAANTLYRFPSRNFTVIGITGTDGKTTSSSLVYNILKAAHKNVSLISTVSAIIDGKEYDTGFHVTNPASVALQRFIQKAKQAKQEYLVLEVTSHGIDQNRIWGIPVTIAGLTNITHEHLDYHKTYDRYVRTKSRFLKKAKFVVLNRDDQSFEKVKRYLGRKNSVITYGKKDADIMPQTVPFTSKLIGEYNIYNCLLAIAICKTLGIEIEAIQKAIASFQPPSGRSEIVYKKEFTVMIDFAHTPNAIYQLLAALRPQVKGKLIHVFGSAGLRDKTKRPLMGKASSEFADISILTAEDPRTEQAESISEQIKNGIHGRKTQIVEQPDRQKAIREAISLAKKGDFVVITGKGHEKSMNYGKGEISWSDHEAVKKALQE